MWIDQGTWSYPTGGTPTEVGAGWNVQGVMCGNIYTSFYDDPLLPEKNFARSLTYGLEEKDFWGSKIRFCRDVDPYEIQ
jgi:hypothetical protein